MKVGTRGGVPAVLKVGMTGKEGRGVGGRGTRSVSSSMTSSDVDRLEELSDEGYGVVEGTRLGEWTICASPAVPSGSMLISLLYLSCMESAKSLTISVGRSWVSED